MKQTIPDSKGCALFNMTLILGLVLLMPQMALLADTQTATVDFTTAKMTNSPLAFSMDESGYGQGTQT